MNTAGGLPLPPHTPFHSFNAALWPITAPAVSSAIQNAGRLKFMLVFSCCPLSSSGNICIVAVKLLNSCEESHLNSFTTFLRVHVGCMRFGTFLKSVKLWFYCDMDCQKAQKVTLSCFRQWQRSSFLLQTHGESLLSYCMCWKMMLQWHLSSKMFKQLPTVLNIVYTYLK